MPLALLAGWICLWTAASAPVPGTPAGIVPSEAAIAGGHEAAPHPGAVACWVFLRDRGSERTAALATAGAGEDPLTLADEEILAAARSLSPAAWARRSRGGAAGLPDLHDLPLHEPYVAEIARLGRLRCRSRWLNAVSVWLTPEARERAAALPFVSAVKRVAGAARAAFGPDRDEEGRPLEALLSVERRPAAGAHLPRTYTPDWRARLTYGPSRGQLSEIAVPPVHGLGYSGNGVRLMMIDTGFYKDHDAFHGADILAEWDFVFGDGETQNEPEDWPWQHHHGTGAWSVAGGFAPGRLVGPAFGASFLLAKTEDPLSETRVEEDYYVAALEWGDSLGVDITSASLNYLCFDGGFCYSVADRDGDTAVITVAVDVAASRGILCVNSLGNYGCAARTTMGTPADADSMLACGAVDSLNVIASFSSCGPTFDGRTKPEVVARGVQTYMAGAGIPDAYGPGSGTSFSTPLVAGAAALLMEAHPEWSAMDVRRALLETADRAAAPDQRRGWGRIDVRAALDWGPVLFPRPFSLCRPAEGASIDGRAPEFAWRRSAAADGASPVSYSVEIFRADEIPPPGSRRADACHGLSGWSVPAGADTLLALPFDLPPGESYLWRVVAEDAAGRRRISRDTRALRIPLGGAAEAASPSASRRAGPRMRIATAANPFRGALRFRVETESAPLPGSAMDAAWALYDALGRRVASGGMALDAGGFRAAWGGTDGGGRPLPPGVYHLEARVGHVVARDTVVRLGQ
ncbi:MAG: S8 family serine peptidase [Candidatus Eisenbacteria bacterium]|uniref:S8 family serine peptidase n=1 Tax=Eiseniibacteriota bacterium TaxID=2212470 RepID=A0A938BQ17_UNCEI|nr:S8 family serine peptidase [Candidatus Eisenbacteria bacterium]